VCERALIIARYAAYRFSAEIIGHAVWLYFRFPVGLRMVEEARPWCWCPIRRQEVPRTNQRARPGVGIGNGPWKRD